MCIYIYTCLKHFEKGNHQISTWTPSYTISHEIFHPKRHRCVFQTDPSDVVVSWKFKLTNTQNGKSSSNHPFFGDLLVSGRLKLRYLCPFRPTKPTAPDKYHGESAGGAAQLTSKDLQFSSDDPKNLTTWQMAILGETPNVWKFWVVKKNNNYLLYIDIYISFKHIIYIYIHIDIFMVHFPGNISVRYTFVSLPFTALLAKLGWFEKHRMNLGWFVFTDTSPWFTDFFWLVWQFVGHKYDNHGFLKQTASQKVRGFEMVL